MLIESRYILNFTTLVSIEILYINKNRMKLQPMLIKSRYILNFTTLVAIEIL